MIRKATSYLLSFLLFTVTSYAQGNLPAVKGRVTDDKGDPLAGVSIQAVNATTNASTGTQTDASGDFSFNNLAPGTYSFSFGMMDSCFCKLNNGCSASSSVFFSPFKG